MGRFGIDSAGRGNRVGDLSRGRVKERERKEIQVFGPGSRRKRKLIHKAAGFPE